MAFQTSNHEIGDQWTELPAGDEVMVQLLNSTPLQLWVGASAPSGDETGHILAGKLKIFRAAALGGAKIFAKTQAGDTAYTPYSGNSRIAVTAG